MIRSIQSQSRSGAKKGFAMGGGMSMQATMAHGPSRGGVRLASLPKFTAAGP
jgi:hypothetical protein